MMEPYHNLCIKIQVLLMFLADKFAKPHLLYNFNDTDQGPISLTSLQRVFVLKTSYEVRTLEIRFHQTIELCELPTFCLIFKTNI